MRALVGVGLSAWVGLSACRSSGPPPLELWAVDPTQGATSSALEVTVRGRFSVAVATDFSRSERTRVEPGFGASLGEVPLEGVRYVDGNTLRAVVPPQLVPGVYALRVEDPFGRVAELPEAFHVVTPREAVASFHVDVLEARRAGVPFVVTVSALDERGELVDGFDQTVRASDLTKTLSPAQLGPFAQGRFEGKVIVALPRENNAISVDDGLGHLGVSKPFDVLSGLAVAVDFVSASQQLVAGTCSAAFELEARDSRGAPSPVERAVVLTFEVGPAGAVSFYADAACARSTGFVQLEVGQERSSFFARATRAGTPTVRVGSGEWPAARQTLSVQAAAAARVDFLTPSQQRSLGACSSAVRLQAVDAFGNPAGSGSGVRVDTSVVPAGAATLFVDPACSVATSGLTLDAQGLGELYFVGQTPGAFVLELSPVASSGLAKGQQRQRVSN